MEEQILELLATQGGLALLFCYLLFYVLQENSKREVNYQEIIKNLSESLSFIKDDIENIKEDTENLDNESNINNLCLQFSLITSFIL